ncbi:hypothetical protein RYX36_007919, partial [Vicia faba]
LEDQGLNYVKLHAATVGIKSEKLESFRISIAKGSPMWETLDSCIKVVDAESLNTLIPRLAHLVRSGVGLNTRVGVANFITLLLESVGVDIKPYANILDQQSIDELDKELSHSDGYILMYGSLLGDTNSSAVGRGNHTFLLNARIGGQQFHSVGSESTSGRSPLRQCSPSPSSWRPAKIITGKRLAGSITFSEFSVKVSTTSTNDSTINITSTTTIDATDSISACTIATANEFTTTTKLFATRHAITGFT